ncbi:MAG: aquaporin [Verrucomicrobia bacterium]|nr:aquaporin [Verrucomicrobiota bacterium]
MGRPVGERRRIKLNWSEYFAEAFGTAFNLFVGLSAGVVNFSSDLPVARLIPSNSLRLLLTGLVFAGSGSLFAISPLGKLSGAHINPSVSLAFFARGKMHPEDLAGYLGGQFLGGLAGAWLLVAFWGARAGNIHNGITAPGAGYPIWFVFFTEFGMTLALVLAIFAFLSAEELMRWTPLMTWFLVAAMVWLAAPVSGTSLNPARSFGPSLVNWFWASQWLYWVAPPTGGLMAALLFHFLRGNRRLLTAKLFHAPDYRCIFKNVHVPHVPVNG